MYCLRLLRFDLEMFWQFGLTLLYIRMVALEELLYCDNIVIAVRVSYCELPCESDCYST